MEVRGRKEGKRSPTWHPSLHLDVQAESLAYQKGCDLQPRSHQDGKRREGSVFITPTRRALTPA